LKNILEKHIEDKDVLWLLYQVIDSFHTKTKNITNATNFAMAEFVASSKKGLPLGNLTSQLLVNIYMNEFDQYIKRKLKEKYYVRYADDFVFLSEDKKYLEKLIPTISDFLETKLKLQLHPNKVYIKTLASGLDFLGWVHFPSHRVLRTSTKKRMFKNIQKNSNKETIASYLGMLSHGDGHNLSQKICCNKYTGVE